MSALTKVIREALPKDMMLELTLKDEKVLLILLKWLTLLLAKPNSFTLTLSTRSPKEKEMMPNASRQDLKQNMYFQVDDSL